MRNLMAEHCNDYEGLMTAVSRASKGAGLVARPHSNAGILAQALSGSERLEYPQRRCWS